MTHPAHPRTSAETEEVLRTIFRDAQDAIGLSHDNVICVVNPSLLHLFGYDDESELVGRTFPELLAPEGRSVILDYVRRRAAGEQVPGMYRVDAVRRDGERFLAEVRTTTFVRHGNTYALAMLRDVGSDRQTADALYEAVFTRNTAVKLLIDPADGSIVDANPAAAGFYGWSVRELRRMKISQINTLSAGEIAAEMDEARLGNRRTFRFRHRVASGEVRGVEVHSGLVEVASRQLLLSIVQDTTERDALEEQLRQAQKLEAIGRLAGGVAHDFNNLLTLMMSCADLLRRELPTGADRAQRYLDDMMHAATRASELTRQLLAVGQRQQLTLQRVAVDEVLSRIEGLLRRAAGPGVTLDLDVEPGLSVEADPGQLEQVVTNLVLNARDATEGEGRIGISAERVGDGVALRVRDDGRGMDAATRARAFEPFFTTRSGGEGAGLGLASVYGIVTQSGGTVTVESEPGQGATFCVTLPFRARPEADRPSPAPTAQPELPARVLVVEDDESLRGVLVESLEAGGLEARALGTGDEAMALSDAELAGYDVVVTDHAMPGRSGVDVARALVARHPSLTVVLISAHVSAGERARLPAGARFLAKPFSGADLARTIRELLAARPREAPERASR
jgi:two-component system, cell cycle sensor histidine kinase and response regulator CckA